MAALLLAALLAAGCSRIPDHGRPYLYDNDGRLPSQAIAYRPLHSEDFHARQLPDSLQNRWPRLNARAAVAIRTVPGAGYLFPPPQAGELQHSCGRLELRFEAVMLPAESWWRADLAKEKEAYVLQHEQIHFALMEMAARQLTRRASMERDRLALCAESRAMAKEQLAAVVQGWLAESREEVLREHLRFDKETSGRFAPEVQQRWYERVTKALEELAAWD